MLQSCKAYQSANVCSQSAAEPKIDDIPAMWSKQEKQKKLSKN